MSNSLTKGFLVGLISPIIAFIIYVGFYKNVDIIETITYLYKVKKLSHVVSLSLISNLPLFFLYLRFKNFNQSRGIIFSMFFYAIIIILLKFIV